MMSDAQKERDAIIAYLSDYQDDLDHRGDSILTGIYNTISEICRNIERGEHLTGHRKEETT
jgi:hypothetical protein